MGFPPAREGAKNVKTPPGGGRGSTAQGGWGGGGGLPSARAGRVVNIEKSGGGVGRYPIAEVLWGGAGAYSRDTVEISVGGHEGQDIWDAFLGGEVVQDCQRSVQGHSRERVVTVQGMFGAVQTAVRHLNRENRGVGENRRVGPEAAAEGQTEIHERSLLRAIKPSIHGLNQGLDRSRIEREGVY